MNVVDTGASLRGVESFLAPKNHWEIQSVNSVVRPTIETGVLHPGARRPCVREAGGGFAVGIVSWTVVR